MDLDSALLGVIVGSLLSLAGNFVNHWFSMRKEEKHWERQQESEDKKRKFEEIKQEKDHLRNIYHNCISRLFLIEASRLEGSKIKTDDLSSIYKEAFDWLSMLPLHHKDLYNDKDYSFHRNFLHELG